ncbi:MAG: phosphoribosylanthranilate isomerase, partial [Deltaproteobacteria bacterium]
MRPWVKICGVTREVDVEACAAAGVDAIGLNFWRGSRRHVTLERARELVTASAAAGGGPIPVGVFVDAGFEEILEACRVTGLGWVQLHGSEPARLVHRLQAVGLTVLRAVSVPSASPEVAHEAPAADLLLV